MTNVSYLPGGCHASRRAGPLALRSLPAGMESCFRVAAALAGRPQLASATRTNTALPARWLSWSPSAGWIGLPLTLTRINMIDVSHLSKQTHVAGRGTALVLPLPTYSAATFFAMPISTPAPTSTLTANAAVLLVLLPPVGTAQPVRAATLAALQGLQQRLGSVIRVLSVDEASHPAVVRSFQPADLPAFVLVRRGVELWRQQGLPEGEFIVGQLLARLAPPPAG